MKPGGTLPGVVLPFWLNRPPLEAVEIARRAERCGFPELWLGEMLHFDAFGLAGHLAAVTEQITICIGPLAVGVRDPVLLGRGLGTVSVLGGRPARLALGGSTPAIVEGFHGRRWRAIPERTRETIRVVRQVAAGIKTDFGGEWVSSRGYRSGLGPQEAHISVAAFGPRMIEVAAYEADRMVLNLVTVHQAARLVEEASRLSSDAGRSPLPVAVWIAAAVDPTAEAVFQLKTQITHYLAAPGYRDMFTAAGFGDLVQLARDGVAAAELAAAIPDRLLADVAAVGSLSEVEARLDQYREVGTDPAVVPVTAGDAAGSRTLSALASRLPGSS